MHFLSGFHAAPRPNTEVDEDYLRQQLQNVVKKPIGTDLKFQGRTIGDQKFVPIVRRRTIGGQEFVPKKPLTENERIALETANQEFNNCLEQGYTKEQCELVFAEALKAIKNSQQGASGGGSTSPQGEESSNTLLYVGAAAAVFAAVFLLRKRSKDA